MLKFWNYILLEAWNFHLEISTLYFPALKQNCELLMMKTIFLRKLLNFVVLLKISTFYPAIFTFHRKCRKFDDFNEYETKTLSFDCLVLLLLIVWGCSLFQKVSSLLLINPMHLSFHTNLKQCYGGGGGENVHIILACYHTVCFWTNILQPLLLALLCYAS